VELNGNFCCLVGRQPVIAFWLIPADPAYSLYQGLINDLARRYDAPVFEPHITIHVGADRADLALRALKHAARKCSSITLTPVGIDESEEFVKTLFVQFALSAALQRMNEIIRNAAHEVSRYELKPHLSLLYNKMEAVARRKLALSIKMSFSEIAFSAIKAVRCISPARSRADVEAWRIVAAASLLR
jgi:2'-5' RNA ligase